MIWYEDENGDQPAHRIGRLGFEGNTGVYAYWVGFFIERDLKRVVFAIPMVSLTVSLLTKCETTQ